MGLLYIYIYLTIPPFSAYSLLLPALTACLYSKHSFLPIGFLLCLILMLFSVSTGRISVCGINIGLGISLDTRLLPANATEPGRRRTPPYTYHHLTTCLPRAPATSACSRHSPGLNTAAIVLTRLSPAYLRFPAGTLLLCISWEVYGGYCYTLPPACLLDSVTCLSPLPAPLENTCRAWVPTACLLCLYHSGRDALYMPARGEQFCHLLHLHHLLSTWNYRYWAYTFLPATTSYLHWDCHYHGGIYAYNTNRRHSLDFCCTRKGELCSRLWDHFWRWEGQNLLS